MAKSKFVKPRAAWAAIGSGVADPQGGQSSATNDVGAYSPKRTKFKEAHASDMQSGMGDYYGTGQRFKMGRMRSSDYPGYRPVNKKQQGTPPTSVV